MNNVFIFPASDDIGLLTLIYHYTKVGCNVLVPKQNSNFFKHKINNLWPALIASNTEKQHLRNFQLFDFDLKTNSHSNADEKFFASLQELGDLTPAPEIKCSFVDLATCKTQIDAYHTLRGTESYLKHCKYVADIYMPSAKWISSTLVQHGRFFVGKTEPKNLVKVLPSSYENLLSFCTSYVYPSDYLTTLFGIGETQNRSGYVTIIDNSVLFSPRETNLLKKLSDVFGVTHYQVSGCRHSNFPYKKISLIEALKISSQARAIIMIGDNACSPISLHCAWATSTPVIASRSFVDTTAAHKILYVGTNCLFFNDIDDITLCFNELERDYVFEKLLIGWSSVKNALVDEQYWKGWKGFLKACV